MSFLARSRQQAPGLFAVGAVALLVGCASPPTGPHVAVMPTPGKPLELFAQEDQYCRAYAQQSIGPAQGNEAAVGAAVVGTLLGAAVGSAMSTRRHDGTAAGAATGLVMGTAIGAGQSQQSGYSAQRRYDIAYEQCMVSKNNQSSRAYYRQPAPAVVVQPVAPAPVAPAPVAPATPTTVPLPPPGVQPPPPPQ